ncbi:cation diffusion facilitator family transporter [Anaeromyxobacter oryzae]|uniref:Transporter n=1 Tax=Anaeromyxobacter oryzae TaxID=2918170 RepID=A0ABM7WNT1_9BACT|nr:cation diffusion facilitator family transporter [Anaeromyxobacter oryzae]BDG01125.1 transporter [Anaeromyxobacter oryzae]
MSSRPMSLARFAWLSIAAAVVTIALKTVAYLLTGSVGLLSDALESIVNLVAATLTLTMLNVAARPEDEEHAYGYGKAEYFASGAEGALILLAAVAIAWTAIARLLAPRPIEQAGLGLVVSTGASLVNLGVARVLLKAGRRHHSIALEADAHHLMTDVWTSAGVLVGIGAVALTGWQRLDPIIAIAVAVNIVWTGVQILRRSARGLLDRALPGQEQEALRQVLARYEGTEHVQFHALRTRQAGPRRFVSLHVLVPGIWTVSRGHALLEDIESGIRAVVPNCNVITHLEALEDPTSWQDVGLDRAAPGTEPRPPAGAAR